MASADLNEIKTVKLSVKFPRWLKPYLWLMKTAHRMGFAVSGDAVVDNIMKSTKIEVR